ncbi:MAG: PIN domain nuclease, partial [Desulfotomaculales bacterium]
MKRVIFFLLVIGFAVAGFYGTLEILRAGIVNVPENWLQLQIGILALGSLVGLVAGLFLSPLLIRGTGILTAFLEQSLQRTPLSDLLMGAVG